MPEQLGIDSLFGEIENNWDLVFFIRYKNFCDFQQHEIMLRETNDQNND